MGEIYRITVRARFGLELTIARALRTPHRQKLALAGELLDAIVGCLCHIEVAQWAKADSMGVIELTRLAAKGSPLLQKHTLACELLNAVVACVGDVDIAVYVDLDPVGSAELSIAVSV